MVRKPGTHAEKLLSSPLGLCHAPGQGNQRDHVWRDSGKINARDALEGLALPRLINAHLLDGSGRQVGSEQKMPALVVAGVEEPLAQILLPLVNKPAERPPVSSHPPLP